MSAEHASFKNTAGISACFFYVSSNVGLWDNIRLQVGLCMFSHMIVFPFS